MKNKYNYFLIDNTISGGKMKKVLSILTLFLVVLSLSGCKDNAKKAVSRYLDKYIALDSDVLVDMNDIISKENLSDENKKKYESIFKKQYQDLKYTILSEEYNGDEAVIKTKITVYDLYASQKESNEYLKSHADSFNDENGVYNADLFIAYKLDKMMKTTNKVDYTIDFYVSKSDGGWLVSALSQSDLEKIHGIYNYES